MPPLEVDTPALKWFRQNEAIHLLRRNVQLIDSGVIQNFHPLSESARIEIAINSYELSQFCKHVGRPIAASHDLVGPEISNISDLIRKFRQAVCHTSTTEIKNYQTNIARMSMNVFSGATPRAIVIGDNAIGCSYEDDVGINFGPYVILLVRHIMYTHNYAAAILATMQDDRRGESIPHFTVPALRALGV